MSLFSFIKESNEHNYEVFKLDLFYITKKLASQECVRDDLEILLQKFLDLFSETLDRDLLNVIIEKYKIDIEKKSKHNLYKHEDGDINFEIEISTIHKVKGETHTATLVVETFKNGYDLFHLLKLLQGKKFAGANEDKKKLLYVAMSRATHFLCLAIHREQKNGKLITSADIAALERSGFRVIS
jgi:superfamily I DNA/RNA helicase